MSFTASSWIFLQQFHQGRHRPATYASAMNRHLGLGADSANKECDDYRSHRRYRMPSNLPRLLDPAGAPVPLFDFGGGVGLMRAAETDRCRILEHLLRSPGSGPSPRFAWVGLRIFSRKDCTSPPRYCLLAVVPEICTSEVRKAEACRWGRLRCR